MDAFSVSAACEVVEEWASELWKVVIGEKKKKIPYKWDDLIKDGLVEYLDAEEEETVMICMTPEDLENSRLQSAGIDPHADEENDDP